MKSALLVIDMQNGFLSPRSPLFIAGAPSTVPACARVIARCREKGVPVVFVTRAYAADGSDVEKPRRAAFLAGGRPLSPGCDEEISAAMPSAARRRIIISSSRATRPFSTPDSTRCSGSSASDT